MAEALRNEYRKAMSFLYGFIDYERAPGWKYDIDHFSLDRMRSCLAALGDPQRHGRFIHVAGTNGKGTVSSIIAKTLTLAGLRTGLYTSPHLISFRERIRIDGRSISRREIVDGVARIKSSIAVHPGLTFFEIWTVLAFDHYRYRNVDASVMEVGMGGRLDATNVIAPDVSVLTSISMDHRGILGDTVSEITREKTGVIKPDVPVVCAPQEPSSSEIIERAARAAGSPLVRVGEDVHYMIKNNRLCYNGLYWSFDDICVPVGANTRFINAAVALAALETLSRRIEGITADIARRGVETVQWPGRFQTVSENPLVIVDGACNTAAMDDVQRGVSALASPEKATALVAMCRDKDAGEVLAILSKCVSRFVVTRAGNPRMLEPEKLARFIPSDVETIIEPDVHEALNIAEGFAGQDGLVIATGSLYLVGEVMNLSGVHSIERI